jgi:hypothetical protein
MQLTRIERMKKSVFAVLASSLLATACAQLPQEMDKFADNLRKIGKTEPAPPSAQRTLDSSAPTAFSQSGLAGVFKNTSVADKWPRVALTIEKMPPDAEAGWLVSSSLPGWGMTGNLRGTAGGAPEARRTVPPPEYCITVSAVIWSDAKTSRQIPATPYCGKDFKLNEISNDYAYEILGWAQVPKADVKNTGTARTKTSLPPLKSFPPRSIIVDNANSAAALMFAHLLIAMGMDLAVEPLREYRLWVVATVQ